MDFLKIAFALVGCPISVYFSVKFGRYGWLAAEELFRKQHTPEN